MQIPNLIEPLDKMFADRIKPYQARSVHASSIGHPCSRWLAYEQLLPKKPHEVGLQRIFDMGNMHEKQALIDLQEALRGTGIEIVQQQMPLPPNRYGIGGRIDWQTKWTDNSGLHSVPTEFKSCSDHVFESINSMEDMINHKMAHVRKYPAQLMIYMLETQTEQGMFIFRNKTTGEYKQINCTLDYEYGETLLKRAEVVSQAVRLIQDQGGLNATTQDAMPARMNYDHDICSKCDHVGVCLPDMTKAPGVEIVSDEELELALSIYEGTKEAASQNSKADDQIKAYVKNACAELKKGENKTLAAKQHIISVKCIKCTKDLTPKEIKAQYAKEDVQLRKTIEKLNQ